MFCRLWRWLTGAEHDVLPPPSRHTERDAFKRRPDFRS